MIDLSSVNRFVPQKKTFFPFQFTIPLRGFLVSPGAQNTVPFLGLPFGLKSAPRIFTKLLKPAATFLRKEGYRIVIYLDDFPLLASSKGEALRLTQMTLSLLQSLGFLINWTKSTLSPHPVYYIRQLCHKLSEHDHLFTRAQNLRGLCSLQQRSLSTSSVSKTASQPPRNPGVLSACYMGSPLALKGFSNPAHTNPEGPPVRLQLSSIFLSPSLGQS